MSKRLGLASLALGAAFLASGCSSKAELRINEWNDVDGDRRVSDREEIGDNVGEYVNLNGPDGLYVRVPGNNSLSTLYINYEDGSRVASKSSTGAFSVGKGALRPNENHKIRLENHKFDIYRNIKIEE